MKFALQADQRIEATPNALGVCPCCGTEMIAKCGNRKVWHGRTKQSGLAIIGRKMKLNGIVIGKTSSL